MKYFHLILISFVCTASLYAQEDSTEQPFPIVFELDPVMISVVRKGFRVEDFIKRVKEDESFHNGFKNLRRYSYSAENKIQMLNRKGKTQASYEAISHHKVRDSCRFVQLEKEKHTGDFFKRKRKYRYYTADMYAGIFLPPDTVCDVYSEKLSVDELPSGKEADGMDKHINQLKILIFNPGAEVEGVPLIGNKLTIFDDKMIKYYDYRIRKEQYRNEIDCYVLDVEQKDSLNYFQREKVVLKKLVTWFEKETYDVLARDYHLSYSSILFDFDVIMHVELSKVNGVLIVNKVRYDGFWDIPFKREERSVFEMDVFNYNIRQ